MDTADCFIIIWILLKMGTNCSYFRDKVVTSKKKDTDTLPIMAGGLFTWKVVSRMAKGKYQEWIEPEGLLKLEGWARDGLTDEQISSNMGITTSTLYVWKNKYSEISEALKRGKEVIDRQVENALLKRALGYKYYEVTIEGGVETKRVTKEVVPDTTAQIFWLKNRKPDVWRDKKDVGLAGELNTNNPFADLTTEELKRLVRDG